MKKLFVFLALIALTLEFSCFDCTNVCIKNIKSRSSRKFCLNYCEIVVCKLKSSKIPFPINEAHMFKMI